MTAPRVSVIIPAFNEAQVIGGLVKDVRERYPDFEVIVIDDGSLDDTALVALDAGAKVYAHPYNIGNGAAVKSGIRLATGEILVFMDGDGQHDPAEIKKLLEYLPDHDMVVGARNIRGQKYVPISACTRKQGKSKIKFFKDGVRFFMIIVRICTLYSPMRVFLPVSFLMFLLGLAWYVYSLATEGRFTNMSALLFTTSIMIFMMSLISEQISQMRFERRGSERARSVSEVPSESRSKRDPAAN